MSDKPHLIEIPAADASWPFDNIDLHRPYIYHRDGKYYAEASEWREYKSRFPVTSGADGG